MKYKIVPCVESDKTSRRCKRRVQVTNVTPFVGCVAVCLAVVFVLAWVLPSLTQGEVADKTNKSHKGVLRLWNVEEFEGGVGSRKSWLTSRAAKFERRNKGVCVCVTSLTYQQAKDKLAQGEQFDVVSFSRGLGSDVLPYLQQVYATEDMLDNMQQSATLGGCVYAFPYYSGIYCLFARESDLSQDQLKQQCLTKTATRKIGKNSFSLVPLTCGFTSFNSPLSALYLSGVSGKVEVSQQTTQYQAYQQFVSNKFAVCLLGTQRDLYRLDKRVADGKTDKLSFLPLDGYCDLVQYLGVNKYCDKVDVCVEFCRYLTSAEVQQTLVDVRMFSVLRQSVYTEQKYVDCQLALSKAYVPNVFADSAAISKQRSEIVDKMGAAA